LSLSPGAYEVEVRQAGFVTFRETGIVIDVNSAKVLNIKLSVGQVSEKVEVSSKPCSWTQPVPKAVRRSMTLRTTLDSQPPKWIGLRSTTQGRSTGNSPKSLIPMGKLSAN
jgi:hypothetical protein